MPKNKEQVAAHDAAVVDAAGVLKELGLPPEYSPESVQRLEDAANGLCAEAARLKREEAPRAERLAARRRIDGLVLARAYLYSLRGQQPGDVSVTVPTLGAPE